MRIARSLVALLALSTATGTNALQAAWPFCHDDCDGYGRRCERDECERREKRRCCHCLHLADPPRGEIAASIPFLPEIETSRRPDLEAAAKERQVELDESVRTVAQDLAKLTLAVEKLVESHTKGQENLSKLSLAVELLSKRQADLEKQLGGRK